MKASPDVFLFSRSTDGSMGMNTQVMAITNETSALARHGRVLGNEGSTAVIRKPQEDMHRYNNSSAHDCEIYKLNATETRRWEVIHQVPLPIFMHFPVLTTTSNAGSKYILSKMFRWNCTVDWLTRKRCVSSMRLREPRKLRLMDLSRKRCRRGLTRRRFVPENVPGVNWIYWKRKILDTQTPSDDAFSSGNDFADNEKLQRKRQNIAKIATIVRQKADTLYIMTMQVGLWPFRHFETLEFSGLRSSPVSQQRSKLNSKAFSPSTKCSNEWDNAGSGMCFANFILNSSRSLLEVCEPWLRVGKNAGYANTAAERHTELTHVAFANFQRDVLANNIKWVERKKARRDIENNFLEKQINSKTFSRMEDIFSKISCWDYVSTRDT